MPLCYREEPKDEASALSSPMTYPGGQWLLASSTMADRQIHRTAEQQALDEEFQRIFDAYYGRVFRFFLSREISRDEAQDLAQETFLRVYRGLSVLRDEQSVVTWLFQIVYNLWSSELRYSKADKRRRSEISLEEWVERDELPAAVPSHAEGQEELLLEEERIRLFQAAVAELPDRMRQCVLLRVRGLRYREIAMVLQISMGAVKALLHQARKHLQAELSLPDLEI